MRRLLGNLLSADSLAGFGLALLFVAVGLSCLPCCCSVQLLLSKLADGLESFCWLLVVAPFFVDHPPSLDVFSSGVLKSAMSVGQSIVGQLVLITNSVT